MSATRSVTLSWRRSTPLLVGPARCFLNDTVLSQCSHHCQHRSSHPPRYRTTPTSRHCRHAPCSALAVMVRACVHIHTPWTVFYHVHAAMMAFPGQGDRQDRRKELLSPSYHSSSCAPKKKKNTMGRIRCLEVENFKSYAGKQVIGPFNDFTAIIGPNGAGSNDVVSCMPQPHLIAPSPNRCSCPQSHHCAQSACVCVRACVRVPPSRPHRQV
jgi:hypothetical protein